MKKSLIVLLVLAMLFTFAACGEQDDTAAEEGLTAIPLGGSLGDIDVSEYGTYVQTDIPEGLYIEEGDQISVYYDENSLTPYIFTYRWPKNDMTLEEETADCADKYGAVAYEMTTTDEGVSCGYYTLGDGDTEEGSYFFLDCWLVEDGDEFVEIDFYGASEEVQIGESNYYICLPAGSDNELTDEEVAQNTLFHGIYAENLGYPEIWLGEYFPTYEALAWYWGDAYPDGLPIDEETFNALIAKETWADEDYHAFYDSFGYSDFDEYHEKVGEIEYDFIAAEWNGFRVNEIYFTVDDVYYYLFTETDAVPAPKYGKAIIDSLHTK